MITNTQSITSNDKDSAAIGKQQLLIKSQLAQRNSLIAKQQLAIKSALAGQRNSNVSPQFET